MSEEVVTKEMRNARIGLLLNGILISSMLIAMLYCQKRKATVRKAINANPKFGSAELLEIRNEAKLKSNKTYFTFEFSSPSGQSRRTNVYDTGARKLTLAKACYPYLIGRRFPMIYSDTHPEKPQILFLRYDFSRKSLAFPDSLKWTEAYLYGHRP